MNSKNDQPLVSLVIASYNHERYIHACIRSVIDQDYQNIELIIIDDGSTDNSCRRIEELVPACIARFVRFEFRNRPNIGSSATVSEGLAWARGQFFAGIASDDIVLPSRTSTLLRNIVDQPDVAGVFGGCELIDAEGTLIRSLRPREAYLGFDDLLLSKRVLIIAPSQLLRTEAVRAVGGYPPNIFIEDWYMWLKLTHLGYRLKTIPNVLVRYRQHSGNMSKQVVKMHESRRMILGQYPDHPGIDLALARLSLMSAIDFSSTSKQNALSYLIKSVREAPIIILTADFFNALCRVLAPNPLLELLRRVKARLLRGSMP
jgi:alpha-1,3-rhamnosyltransferase